MIAQPSVLQVVILRDGLLVGTEVFVPGSYTLGSARGVDLRLEDPSIGAHHATLYFQNGKAAIQDAGGSPRGVYVNGHRVKACEVRPVDEVLCGPFILKARVLQQRQQKQALPPEVAHLLQATPASGSVAAAARPQVAYPPQPLVLKPVPAVPGTAPSARRMAEQQARPAARPLPTADDRSAKEVEAFFHGEEHPTGPSDAATANHRGLQAPASGGFVAARALSASGELVNQGRRAPHPSEAPTLGVQLPEGGLSADWELAAPAPDPVLDERGIPTSSVVDFQWPAADPELEESQPAYRMDEPLAPVRSAPPVPAPPVAPPASAARAAQPVPAARPVPGPVARAASVPAPLAAPVARPTSAALPAKKKLAPPGKRDPRLYLELSWDGARHKVWSFTPSLKKPVRAGASETADVQLYGFGLEQDFVLGEQAEEGGYRVFVPAGLKVERGNVGGKLTPLAASALETDGDRRFLRLQSGASLRLSAGNSSLLAYVAPPPEKIKVRYLRQFPLLLTIILLGLSYGFGSFLYYAPAAAEREFAARDMPSVAIRLIAPEPKKKERVKKALAEMAQRADKREKKTPRKKTAPAPGPKSKPTTAVASNKALNAIKKLQAAGPASGDILSAMDKVGSGPGNKNAKGYQLTGLIGKGAAAAGTGTSGLGGGGLGKG
ncbi:MAG: FHA domain-containing protein, partial [Myxococcota bacterium]|nr:FHA domain-containing protein [Myxococcota bacterium]